MTRDLEALLFDLDGVLVDSRDAIARSINHALVAHGAEPRPETELHALIGAPLPEAFADLLAADGGDVSLVPACMTRYRERYGKASLVETTVFPGIGDALAALGRRHRLAVATTKPAEYARPILETLGLDAHFEVVLGSPLDTGRSEPKTETIGRVLEALGVERAAMVGDRRFDVEGARAHGLFAVGVTWGAGTEAELREAGADALVHAPAELVTLLGR